VKKKSSGRSGVGFPSAAPIDVIRIDAQRRMAGKAAYWDAWNKRRSGSGEILLMSPNSRVNAVVVRCNNM